MFEEVVVDLVEEFQSWERRLSGKFIILRKCQRWAFLFQIQSHISEYFRFRCKKKAHICFVSTSPPKENNYNVLLNKNPLLNNNPTPF